MDSLPLGFRFRPTDEELIDHYLRHKINGRHSEVEVIPEVDICKWEPWDLPRLSVIKSNDPEWFFFCPLDRKYPNRHRTNRATDTGYWKATGKDRTVKSRKSSNSGCSTTHLIGTKKTLVFYKGRAPKGERTHYIMHEYRATQPDLDGTSPGQTAYVLCRLFRKHNEKAEDSDYNDAIGNHAFPTEDKSSPDQVSSDLYHEPSFQETPAARQPESRLTSERDDRTCNGYRHVSSFMSDDDDHSIHAAATEVQGIPHADGTRYFLPSPYGTNIGCADSPFTDDFGSNQNGLLFQDGTSEQDACLSELLDILHNHDNHLSGESTAKKSCDVGSKELMSDSGSGNFLVQGTLSCSDSKMVEEQGLLSQSSSQVEVYSYDAVSKMSNIRMLSERYNGTHSASYNAPLASCNPAQSCADNVSVSHDNSPEFGTGIKIRKRQHQQPQHQPSHEYLAAQGDAERRIHLQLEKSPNYTSSAESSEGSNFSNREELDGELNITEACEVCDSCSIEGGEEGSNSNGRRGSRRKYGNSKKKGKKAYLLRWWSHSQQSSEAKLSKVCYYVCLNLVFVLLVIVLLIFGNVPNLVHYVCCDE